MEKLTLDDGRCQTIQTIYQIRIKLSQVQKIKVYTVKNFVDKSYLLVKHFLDFPLWEYRIA